MIPARVRVGSQAFHSDKSEASLKKSLILCACVLVTIAAVFAAGGYHLLRTIPVGGTGGWDYLTVDEPGQRLFVSHETQVEVIDLASNSVIGKIPDTPEFTVLHSRRKKAAVSSATARPPGSRFST